MKEKRSGSGRRITLSAGAPAAVRCSTHRPRVRPVGSPNQDASTPLRAAHSILGSSHEIFFVSAGINCP